MTTIGILGAGQAGSVLARVAIRAGYEVVLANTRRPDTLARLVHELGEHASAATLAEAAAAADFAVFAFPYRPDRQPPAGELAGKVVIDIDNYMPWRDGRLPEVDSGATTLHELRQAQVPAAKLVKAFTHVQFHARYEIRTPSDALPAVVRLARPRGAPDRKALAVSGDHADAVTLVSGFIDEIGFDAVDAGPLSESWRSAPGTPMWRYHVDGRSRAQLVEDLRRAERPRP